MSEVYRKHVLLIRNTRLVGLKSELGEWLDFPATSDLLYALSASNPVYPRQAVAVLKVKKVDFSPPKVKVVLVSASAAVALNGILTFKNMRQTDMIGSFLSLLVSLSPLACYIIRTATALAGPVTVRDLATLIHSTYFKVSKECFSLVSVGLL